MNDLINIIGKIITALIFAGVFFLTTQMALDKVEKYLKIKAVHECAQIASVSYTNADGATVTEPYKPAFESCLETKGY